MKIAQVVEEYIALKRSIGMRFTTQRSVLKAFCGAIGSVDATEIEQAGVQAFLSRSQPITSSWHLRFYALRGLFRFAIERGFMIASPLPHIIPKQPAYAKPYIYSPEELRRLLDAAKELDSRQKNSIRGTIPAQTFRTLILLLYGAGLRLSEALALTIDDVDLSANQLVVRNTKFYKTRLLPIGPKLSAALALYAQSRAVLSERPPASAAFFLRRWGKPLSGPSVEYYFRLVRARADLGRSDGAYFQPRLHDLRHTFAVHRLVAWYRSGADVQRLLPQLSTYLGHIGLAETQHYLTMTPELLREANRRFESYASLEVGYDK